MGMPTNFTVLLVDDTAEILRSVCRLFRRQGFEVVARESAESAAEALASTTFDAILTDHDMGGHDGVWLLRLAQAAQPSARRVLTSGRDIPGIDDLIADGLVHSFLAKPVDETELVEAVYTRSKRRGR